MIARFVTVALICDITNSWIITGAHRSCVTEVLTFGDQQGVILYGEWDEYEFAVNCWNAIVT